MNSLKRHLQRVYLFRAAVFTVYFCNAEDIILTWNFLALIFPINFTALEISGGHGGR